MLLLTRVTDARACCDNNGSDSQERKVHKEAEQKRHPVHRLSISLSRLSSSLTDLRPIITCQEVKCDFLHNRVNGVQGGDSLAVSLVLAPRTRSAIAPAAATADIYSQTYISIGGRRHGRRRRPPLTPPREAGPEPNLPLVPALQGNQAYLVISPRKSFVS